MSDTVQKQQTNKLGILDIFIVFFCLGGAAASLYLFQHDLFNTMSSFVNLPAGTISVKYNTVQRRFKDRMIWDRLNNESPVYNGDLIRVARLSGAVITIDNNSIELGENTLIRIQSEDGSANINFFSGEINIASSAGGGAISLSIGDKVVQAASGTAFSASSGDDGVVLRVTEGTAQIISSGQTALASAGTVIAQDAQGGEKIIPAAAVIQPKPNARYLKTGSQSYNLYFEWSRINMQRTDPIRLEIAEDRNFTRLRHILDNLDSSAVAAVGAGLWHWRLLSENTVLASGRVTVAEAAAPTLFNAVVSGSEAQLRWVEVEQASGYIIQVSKVSDFSTTAVSTQVQGNAFVMPDVEIGTWYWRVRPVFSSAYEGVTSFSTATSFQVERKELPALSLNMPANESAVDIDEAADSIYFSWSASRDAASYTIQISSQNDPGNIIRRTVYNNYFVYGRNEAPLALGRYTWSVLYSDARGNLSPSSSARAFSITQRDVNQRLVYPPDRHTIESGQISSLRFSWETNLTSDRRFQVSAREDFSSLTVDVAVSENFYQGLSLPVGEWYWRLSARRSSMSQAVATSPRRFTLTAPVLPEVAAAPPVAAEALVPPTPAPSAVAPAASPPAPSASVREISQVESQTPAEPVLLQPPGNRRPVNNYQIGEQELRQQRNIVFSWNAVAGANAYILSIYNVTPSGRTQIFNTEVRGQQNFTFDKLDLFDNTGTYVWQVEAIRYNSQGIIEQHGQPGENTFTLNVPRPARVQTKDTGVLYGN